MKLTNTVIKKLIKEELVKLQEQGDPEVLRKKLGAATDAMARCYNAAGGGTVEFSDEWHLAMEGACAEEESKVQQLTVQLAQAENATATADSAKKAAKTERNKRINRKMRRHGGDVARKMINQACFGDRVTGKAMRAARKANKCPESRLTYKDWVAGRRAAQKNDHATVEKLIASAGGSPDVGTDEDTGPVEFAAETTPEQKVQAVAKKFGKTEEKAKKIVAAAQTVSENDAELLAQDLYKAMKGAGTDEKKAYGAFRYLKTDGDINALTRAFDKYLIKKKDTDDGGLYQWLVDDGLDDLAKKVAAAGKSWGKKIVSSGDVEERERSGKGWSSPTSGIEESQTPTFSSFPDQQKLFENWNHYLKED